MNLADRIKEMLGKGIPSSAVASAVGCDPSYVSQLMENDDFKNEVFLERAKGLEAGIVRDNNWDEIEDLALKQAKATLPFVTRPSELIRIAQLANSAKRRATEAQGIADGSSAPQVTLVFSQQAAVSLKFNSEAQVISVDGRSMQALPTNKLAGMVAQLPSAASDIELLPSFVAKTPAREAEKQKVLSTLEAIGGDLQPPHVPNVLEKESA